MQLGLGVMVAKSSLPRCEEIGDPQGCQWLAALMGNRLSRFRSSNIRQYTRERIFRELGA